MTLAAESVRVGVIGVGGMGRWHAVTLAQLAHVDIVGVVDPHTDSARSVAAEVGCGWGAEPLELVAADLDAVVIASPDDTHPELAIAALERDLWVLCEKPLATDLTGARRVLEAESAHGRRRVQLGFMRQFDPAHVQLVDELSTLGPIDVVRTVHRNVNRVRRPLEQIVGQSMVHDFHSVRFITGAEVTDVTAFGAGPSDGSYRHVVARCQLDNGGHALVEFDDAGYAYDVSVEVLAASGDAVTGAPLRATRRADGALSRWIGPDWFGWFADAYRIQDQAWIRSIRAGVAAGPSTWDGVVAQAIVDATLRSLRTGCPVAVEVGERPTLYA